MAASKKLHAQTRFFSDLDLGTCIFKENVPIETFNISFESTQNKQQYGTNITPTEVSREKLWWFQKLLKLLVVLTPSTPFYIHCIALHDW